MSEAQAFISEFVSKSIGHSVEFKLAISLAKLKCASFTTIQTGGFDFVFNDQSSLRVDSYGFAVL